MKESFERVVGPRVMWEVETQSFRVLERNKLRGRYEVEKSKDYMWNDQDRNSE